MLILHFRYENISFRIRLVEKILNGYFFFFLTKHARAVEFTVLLNRDRAPLEIKRRRETCDYFSSCIITLVLLSTRIVVVIFMKRKVICKNYFKGLYARFQRNFDYRVRGWTTIRTNSRGSLWYFDRSERKKITTRPARPESRIKLAIVFSLKRIFRTGGVGRAAKEIGFERSCPGSEANNGPWNRKKRARPSARRLFSARTKYALYRIPAIGVWFLNFFDERKTVLTVYKGRYDVHDLPYLHWIVDHRRDFVLSRLDGARGRLSNSRLSNHNDDRVT